MIPQICAQLLGFILQPQDENEGREKRQNMKEEEKTWLTKTYIHVD